MLEFIAEGNSTDTKNIESFAKIFSLQSCVGYPWSSERTRYGPNRPAQILREMAGADFWPQRPLQPLNSLGDQFDDMLFRF